MNSSRTNISPLSNLAARAAQLPALLLLSAALLAPGVRAQGSRKDDIVFGAQGKPVAGATITVCTSTATGTPCAPLATLYTDATLTVVAPNPFTSDGLGNYHFYAPPARYIVQISGGGINTYTVDDVILPNDPTSPSFSSVTSTGGITATTLTLGGNLSVSGDAGITGTLTAGTFSIMNFAPTSLTVTGDATIQGPRPKVDVTAYGAKGDGVTDDTAAIQAAITAVCKTANAGGGGVLYFPPATGNGYYVVAQPSSNAPIFDLSPCSGTGITLEGGGTAQGTIQQFSRTPMTRILANPAAGGLGPIFLVGTTNPQVTFRNLQIYGYNQAVQINTATGTVFENVALGASNAQNAMWNCTTTDCTSDNTPLAIYSSFWIWMNQMSFSAPVLSTGWNALTSYSLGTPINTNVSSGGYLMRVTTAGTSGSTPPNWPTQAGQTVTDGTVVWTNQGTSNGYAAVLAQTSPLQGTGLIRLDKSTSAGGGFLWDHRDPATGSEGNYEFHSVYVEGGGLTPFLTVLDSSGGGLQVGPIHIENSALYDCPNGVPLVQLNTANVTLTPILITNSQGCNASAPVQAPAGAAAAAALKIEGGTYASRIPADSSGNPIPAYTQNLNGFDAITSIADTNRLRTDITSCCGPGTGADGTPIRMTPSGAGKLATLGIDPGQSPGQGGILFSDGANGGYNANVLQESTSPDTLDIAFAQALPPTGVGASNGGAGSCAAGTYYYIVSSYSGSVVTQSPASAEVSITLALNQAATISWTAAVGPNVSGYVVTRGATPGGEYFGGGKQYVVSGGSSTSFTDTCGATGSGSPPYYNQTFAAFHRFSQRKLGVNNTSPAAQLDVTAQDAATVGFNIKAAASPAANIWQVTDSTGAVRESVDNNLNLVVGRHLAQPSANGDLAGRISISSSTSGTHSFSTAFSSSPVCTASPTANPGALTWWVTAGTGSVTVNLSASGTITFNYVCAGNPN